ncbi:MAG: hypothetical protein EHM89_02715 [Acidobacteria bacterium]|nr:MAG: hypothetical protein EHM89_02715 [Acidobacteriota bacterium]
MIDRLRPEVTDRAPVSPAPSGRSAIVGDRVLVSAFGLEGTVAAVHDREAEVDVKGKRLRSRLSELKVLDAVEPAGARVRVDVHLQPRSDVLSELNLVGATVDDALTRVDKFLDESLLTEQRIIRLIHGYGTGQLRRAIATYLETHPLVAHFQPAPPDQGGGGVTVVELKE